MKMQAWLMLVFVFAFVLSVTSDGFAALYKYIDKDGMICIADDLQSVPETYRATAKIVSGESGGEKKPMPQHQLQSQQEIKTGIAATSPSYEQVPAVDIKKSFFINRVLISSIVVVSVLFAFVILGILDADHKKAVKIVRVVIVWGMSVYLIFAHAGDVIHIFRSMGNTVDTAQRKAEEKGKKAAKALKELNALTQEVDNAATKDTGGSDQEKRD